MGTSVLRYGNALERKQWMTEGLVQSASKSFWNGLTGNSSDSIIYQKNDLTQSKGQTVIFDYSGNFASEGFRGKEQAFGNAKAKLKFSDSLVLEYGRYTVDNGMEFDAATIGDMDLSTHSNSKSLLADNFVRAKDQMFFDIGQGYLRGKGNSHVYRVGQASSIANMTATDKFTWDDLVNLETLAKTGKGFSEGSDRAPLKPFHMGNGKPVWLLVLDPWQIQDLLQDAKFQAIYQSAEVRGNNNALISHAIARVGSLVIMEAGAFSGYVKNNLLFKQAVEMQGLRTIDEAGNYSGTTVSQSGIVASRGLLLGAGAFQLAMGTMPDYKFQPSPDFEIVSESALILTMNADKTTLTAEVEDYKQAKIANMDFAIVAVDSYREVI